MHCVLEDTHSNDFIVLAVQMSYLFVIDLDAK